MSAYLSTDLGGSANQTVAPTGYKPPANVQGGRFKRLRGLFTYASQATTDTLVIGTLPAGATFAYGVINTSASMGTATLAVGIAGATSKFKAAGTAITATDTPTMFGVAAEAGGAALAADTQVFCTIGTAALPASGTLVVDLYYSVAS